MQKKIDRLAVSIPEAAEAIGVCRAQGYKMVNSGELPSIDVGRRKLVPVEGLKQYVVEQTQKATR
jgi:excisionase family DNA binding protein